MISKVHRRLSDKIALRAGSLIYKLGQSTYNLRILHFIKTQCASRSRNNLDRKNGTVADFIIR